jgi:membrane protease subunit (stomatin/prohibitin family)
MEAERAQVEIQQMRQAMQSETVFSGDTSAKTTVCTNCGKPVGSERFCANCGRSTGQAKCTDCGNDLAPGTPFCGNCGTPVG